MKSQVIYSDNPDMFLPQSKINIKYKLEKSHCEIYAVRYKVAENIVRYNVKITKN